jgi:hypothetical protein
MYCFPEEEFVRNWPRFQDTKVHEYQTSIGDTIRHLRELHNNSVAEQQSRAMTSQLSIRDRIILRENAEKAPFPLELLPQIHTEHFVGRQENMEKMHQWLERSKTGKIQWYHIFGRRGIGK